MVAYNKKKEMLFTLLGFSAWGFTFLSRTALSYYTDAVKLSAGDLGTINLVTAVMFCVSTIIIGKIADKKQNHTFLMGISCLIVFAMSLLTPAVINSHALLLIVRSVLGIGCGPIYALAAGIIRKEGRAQSYSLNLGIVSNGEALLASAAGPIIIVALLDSMSWVTVNSLIALSVLLVALAAFYSTKHTVQIPACAESRQGGESTSLKELLKYRNVILSAVLATLSMIALWIVLIFAPLYWTDVAVVDKKLMSQLIMLMGLSYAVWNIILPGISEKFGRKPVCVVFGVLGGISLLAMFLTPQAFFTKLLFVLFAGISSSLAVFFMGVIPVESVPSQLTTSSCSVVDGIANLAGVAIGPWIGGIIADYVGLTHSMLFAAICMFVAALLSCFLKETVVVK